LCSSDQLRRLNRARIDILEIVRGLREQRHGMVQMPDQYAFCYRAILEAATQGWLSDESGTQ
jgi:protein tyrosine phosphatase